MRASKAAVVDLRTPPLRRVVAVDLYRPRVPPDVSVKVIKLNTTSLISEYMY